ncbi:MAG TPA: FliM/FliN family flagellar motor switch protein [Pirellulales bacterium]|nr:FliM/FliN family flagellar motor switch protein [Pirellulales bacterium]
MLSEFGPAIADQVVATCQGRVAEIGAAWSRLVGSPVSVAVGDPTSFNLLSPPAGLDGPGLVVLLTSGASAALVILPEEGGLLPDWYAEPNADQQGVLATLAQELGPLILPEPFMPEGFQAARVSNLGEALLRGGVAAGAALLPWAMTAELGKQATASMLWPATRPSEILLKETPRKPPGPAPQAFPSAPAVPQPPSMGVDALPAYARSLLRIKVPVIVTLAAKKQPIGRIVELGTGSIIQFDKSCEEMLALHVADQAVAEGEAVKVGDKFGIRVTSLIVPGERFKPVRKR